MKCIIRCLQIVFFLSLNKLIFAIEKQWIVDFEWNNEKNWDHVPEIDGHIIFPLETRHAVGLAKTVNLKLSKIDLPREGSLVLFRNGKLEFSESKNSETKISRWLKEGKFFWADPDNWNGVSDAAPHMERIPCSQDNVVLPGTDQTFNIHLPVKDIQVESIRLSNHKYPSTWWDWEEMQKKKEFLGGFLSVKYSQYDCQKCFCQDGSQYDYFKEICAIQGPKCGFAACEYPLKIEGHCCLYCGGRIIIPKGASLAMIRSLADEVLEQRATNLAWYVRRTWTDNIEILLKEKSEYTGVDTLIALEDLQTKLHNENIEILYTENPGAPLKDSRLATMLGPFFGAPIIILILLITGFWYFDYSIGYVLSEISGAWSSVKEKSNKPFSFARFENILEGNVRIEDPQTRRDEHEMNEELITEEEEVLDEEGTSVGGNFENPLYRSKRDKKFKIEERELINVDLPLSLTSLKNRVKDNTEDDDDIEMDIEQ
ncbi:protein amnionless [Vespa crabro]|uniref:protein amnionless n=1 Tax=Vespa crabro TaxID=7445 RepID=UPI001F02186F|nr:protein amnionless [Vespa crabro]